MYLFSKFGLGLSLGLMILFAGTTSAIFFGWMYGFILVWRLKENKCTYSNLFFNGVLAFTIGLHWIWPTILSLSENNLTTALFYFPLFVALHASYFPLLLFLYKSLPKKLDRFSVRATLSCITVDCFAYKLFPWEIGHSQWSFPPFIQIAEVGGVVLISAAMITICDLTYQILGKRCYVRALILATGISIILAFGIRRITIFSSSKQQTLAVSIVQVAPSTLNDDQNNLARLRKLQALTEQVKGISQLTVWPELSLPYQLHESIFKRDNDERLRQLPSQANILFGSKSYRRPNKEFNSVFLLQSDGRILLPYHKRLPIPFGEFIPLVKLLPFLKTINPQAENLSHGDSSKVFQLVSSSAQIAPLICYEEIFSLFALDAVQNGANLLAFMSDDSWSGLSGDSALRQHYTLAAFRSIEQRRSIVRSSATGISSVIDPTGRELARIPINQDAVLTTNVPLETYLTIYNRNGGDRIWHLMSVIVIAMAIITRILSRSPVLNLSVLKGEQDHRTPKVLL